MYNIKLKIISQDIDEKENGTYKFEFEENNEIKFTAIKKLDNLIQDFFDNYHKYYFDKWESTNKEKFIQKNISNEILDYTIYLVINSYEDIEKV